MQKEINEFLKGMKDGEKFLGQMAKKTTIHSTLQLIITGASALDTSEGQAIVAKFLKATKKIAKGYRKGMKKVVKTFLTTSSEFDEVASMLESYFSSPLPDSAPAAAIEAAKNLKKEFVSLDI